MTRVKIFTLVTVLLVCMYLLDYTQDTIIVQDGMVTHINGEKLYTPRKLSKYDIECKIKYK